MPNGPPILPWLMPQLRAPSTCLSARVMHSVTPCCLTRYSDPVIALTFNRATTHLLCPTAMGAKYARARAWGTPVVDMRWLLHIARTDAPPSPGMFLVPDSQDAEMSDVINRMRGVSRSST